MVNEIAYRKNICFWVSAWNAKLPMLHAYVWYGMECMVCYGISKLWYEICMLCFAMVCILKDQHSATVLSPLEKRRDPSYEQIWIPHHPRLLCAKFGGWNWPRGSGEENENVKSLRTDGQTDDERQAIRKAHLSFQFRWAKNYLAYQFHKNKQNLKISLIFFSKIDFPVVNHV